MTLALAAARTRSASNPRPRVPDAAASAKGRQIRRHRVRASSLPAPPPWDSSPVSAKSTCRSRSRAVRSRDADHGRKIRIRNVGHDDGDDAGPSRLHFSGGPIRGESKTRDRRFDAASAFRAPPSPVDSAHATPLPGCTPALAATSRMVTRRGCRTGRSRYSPAVERLRDSPFPAAGHARASASARCRT